MTEDLKAAIDRVMTHMKSCTDCMVAFVRTEGITEPGDYDVVWPEWKWLEADRLVRRQHDENVIEGIE